MDVCKFAPMLVDLSRLSDLVKNDVVKKTGYDELFKNVDATPSTDTRDLVIKTGYNRKINEVEKQIIDHDHSNKYITTQEFNILTADNFSSA